VGDRNNVAASVRLTDFGLGRRMPTGRGALTDPKTDVMAFCGTPSHMAPEQDAWRQLGAATDVYTLGLLLVELQDGCPSLPQQEALLHPRNFRHWLHATFPTEGFHKAGMMACVGDGTPEGADWLLGWVTGPILERREAAGAWPAGLRGIVEDCMEADPLKRPSAADVLARLTRLADSLQQPPVPLHLVLPARR